MQGQGQGQLDAEHEIHQEDRQEHSHGSAQHGQHGRLGQQIPDQPAPLRSKGKTHGYLATARLCPCQKKAGQVDAGDEEHEGDHRHHHRGDAHDDAVQSGVNGGAEGGRRLDASAKVPVAVTGDEVPREGSDDRLRLGQGHSVGQPGLHHEGLLPAPGQASRTEQGDLVRHRRMRPDVGLQPRENTCEVRLGNANDRIGESVDSHGRAHDAGVGAECPAPVAVAQYNDGVGTDDDAFTTVEHAAHLCTYSEDLEVGPRDELVDKVVAPPRVIAEVDHVEHRARHTVEHGRRRFFQFPERGVGEVPEGVVRRGQSYVDQLIGIQVRQWAKQKRVHQRKEGGVAPDPDRDRDYGQ